MKESQLEREIRRRLTQVMIEASDGPATDWTIQVAQAITQETIRQMEWARRECGWTVRKILHEDRNSITTDEDLPPLTLAPPEWKP